MMCCSSGMNVETRIYQVEARHETCNQPLNVVVIVKRHQTTGKQAHVSLFSSGRTLAWDVCATIISCGSRLSSPSAMPNNTGAWRTSWW